MSTSAPVRGHGSCYIHLRSRAVTALVLLGNVDEAAKSINIHGTTLRRWMLREDFVSELQTLREQLRTATLSKLVGWLDVAVESLRKEALSAPRSADRTRAWRTLLGLERQLDSDRLRERLEKLERELAELKRQTKPAVVVNAQNAHMTVAADVIASVLAARRDLSQRQAQAAGRVVIDAAKELPALPQDADG